MALEAVTGQEGLALRLMYATGQRLSDVERWTPEHLSGATLKFHQKKTGNLVQLTLPEEMTYVLGDLGRAPGQRYIQVPRHKIYRTWNRVREELGMSDYTPHGLRKSASCEAAEGGATEAELQAMLGHKTPRAAMIYRQEADQGILAASAMSKRSMK